MKTEKEKKNKKKNPACFCSEEKGGKQPNERHMLNFPGNIDPIARRKRVMPCMMLKASCTCVRHILNVRDEDKIVILNMSVHITADTTSKSEC